MLRQLARGEERGSFEPAAELSGEVRRAVEGYGIQFAEETEHDEPAEATEAFVHTLGLDPGVVEWIAEGWQG